VTPSEPAEQTEYRSLVVLRRERLGWGKTQIKLHVDRLIEME